MNFYDNIADIHLNIDPDLFDLLKNCIEHIPELAKYEFTKKEFYVLYQALVYGGLLFLVLKKLTPVKIKKVADSFSDEIGICYLTFYTLSHF